MNPRQLQRRLKILGRLWPTRTPFRDIQRVLDRDGQHWAEKTCRSYATQLGVRRPQPAPSPGSGAAEPTVWEVRVASRLFAASYTSAAPGPLPPPRSQPQNNETSAPPPWRSVTARVRDPRLAIAARQARSGRMGRLD